MASSKLKSKAKLKVKSKPKSKAKIKSKRKVLTKKKATKPVLKRKPVKKNKSTKILKEKTRVKRKASAKTVKSKTPKRKQQSKMLITFSNMQKASLLGKIAALIELHKADKDGLKSLTQIDRIIDKYNQHYTNPSEKFDAIVKYGMDEDPAQMSKNFYINAQPKDKETADLFQLLLEIGKGKAQFPEIKTKIYALYTNALKSRRK